MSEARTIVKASRLQGEVRVPGELRTAAQAFWLAAISEGELYGRIAVLLDRLLLDNEVRSGFEYGHGHGFAGRDEDLAHPKLLAEQFNGHIKCVSSSGLERVPSVGRVRRGRCCSTLLTAWSCGSRGRGGRRTASSGLDGRSPHQFSLPGDHHAVTRRALGARNLSTRHSRERHVTKSDNKWIICLDLRQIEPNSSPEHPALYVILLKSKPTPVNRCGPAAVALHPSPARHCVRPAPGFS